MQRGLQAEGTQAEAAAVDLLVDRAGGDGRQVLTALEVACALAEQGILTAEHVEAALGTSALRYGRDDHYDVVSAFIKSVRGSDPQAAVYYLARMLEAGEDARFIARRMVILASEDIGLADPQALVVAVAAAHALEHVGLPEAQLNLAQAAVHLAMAPKSNRVALAIWNARSDVRDGAVGEVPAHLRDSHYKGAAALGHGVGYEYPHDHADGWVDQQYLPDGLADRVWYEPSRLGHEAALADERAAAALVVFLVHERGENDLRLARARAADAEFEQRGEVGGDAALGVARATAVEPPAIHHGPEARFAVHTHGVHVRREQDAPAGFASGGREVDEQVGAAGENLLPFQLQPGAVGSGGEEIRDATLAGEVTAAREERGVHAGQRDEFAQELMGGSGHRRAEGRRRRDRCRAGGFPRSFCS